MIGAKRPNHEVVMCERTGGFMQLLPRFTTSNSTIVKQNNGEPYSTGYYDTPIKPSKCCGKDPDLYAVEKINGFLLSSEYEFKCKKCGKVGGKYHTANGAAASWNGFDT